MATLLHCTIMGVRPGAHKGAAPLAPAEGRKGPVPAISTRSAFGDVEPFGNSPGWQRLMAELGGEWTLALGARHGPYRVMLLFTIASIASSAAWLLSSARSASLLNRSSRSSGVSETRLLGIRTSSEFATNCRGIGPLFAKDVPIYPNILSFGRSSGTSASASYWRASSKWISATYCLSAMLAAWRSCAARAR